jgi:uncharacterized protein involved in response to NO
MTAEPAGIPRYKPFAGPVLFQAGFRPFFLAAGLWAPLALLLWLGFFLGHLELPTAFAPVAWHSHEMIFGFAMAAVAGFLLTAIPNWTGRMPLQGWPLIGLASLWLAGRIGTATGALIGAPAAAALDLAFIAVLLAAVAREIVAGRNWRNLPMVGALTLLLAANLLYHLEPLGLADGAALGERTGLATLLMLIALVGGRIIPSFTRNWLAKSPEPGPLPAAFGPLDRLALGIAGLALAFWVADATPMAAGALLIFAALAGALRLVRWRGWRTAREPLLLVLHLGHGWLALGLGLLGFSHLGGEVPLPAALHALTVGAIATMILAVMTRATLGHTGRELSAGMGTTAIYVSITLAAVARVVAGFGHAYEMLLMTAGAAWVAAFALFLLLYGPMLLRPRARPPA